jgi:hypothetical protein
MALSNWTDNLVASELSVNNVAARLRDTNIASGFAYLWMDLGFSNHSAAFYAI